MTIRPLITAPPDSPTPSSSNQGQLANLVVSDTTGPVVTSQPKQPGKKYHRRGKERRFGRGFRLIRNRHPFAEDFQVDGPRPSSSSTLNVLPTAPTVGPPQTSPSPPPQFANQVLSLDQNSPDTTGTSGATGQQQLLTTNTPSSPSSPSSPIVNTFDNQILDSADQTEVNKRDEHCSWLILSSRL